MRSTEIGRKLGSCQSRKLARKSTVLAVAKSRLLWVPEGSRCCSENRVEEQGSKIGVEIRHIVVDSLENGEVELFLRPNASLACGAIPDRFKTVVICTFTTEQWIPHSPRPGR